MKNPNLYEVMYEFGTDLVAEIKSRLQSLNKVASGDLINSISFIMIQTSEGWEVDITSENYLKYIESGRRPGSKQPPTDVIKPWIESKGIKISGKTGYISTDSAAFVIARSIGEKGIKPVDIIQPAYETIYARYKSRIADAISKDIIEKI
jgi:hypothetical protein